MSDSDFQTFVEKRWGKAVFSVASLHCLPHNPHVPAVALDISHNVTPRPSKVCPILREPLIKVRAPFTVFFVFDLGTAGYLDYCRAVRRGYFHAALNSFIRHFQKPVFCITEHKNTAARKAALKFNPTEVSI
jgi:hypothetical protein